MLFLTAFFFERRRIFDPDGTLQSQDSHLIEWEDGSAPNLLRSGGWRAAMRQLNREY